ncbi:unnamed protein product [Pedinophyceae sp. YPF-701]|nr:unnamed protein product [Pedinophyceae sp. YPF-701]
MEDKAAHTGPLPYHTGHVSVPESTGAEFYDADFGNKATLARVVAESPRRYKIMSSTAPRFREAPSTATPGPGVYEINQGHKKGFEKTIEDSRVTYAVAFKGTERKFDFGSSSAPDAWYEVEDYKSVKQSLEQTARQYSNMRSRRPRFQRQAASQAPDVVYDTDVGPNKSLASIVRDSPRKYTAMSTVSTAGRSRASHNTTLPDIGPGRYVTKTHWELRRDPPAWDKPSSSFLSTGRNKKKVKRHMKMSMASVPS